MGRTLGTIAALFVLAVPSTHTAQNAKTPARLEQYLTNTAKVTGYERTRLLGGAPITKLLPADASKEVAIFGAIWVNAPIGRYVEAVKDIENLERGGGYRVTRRISTPPKLEDFNQMHLTKEDVSDLRSCRVGDCELKLGQEGLELFRNEVKWNEPGTQAAADHVMRRLALEYVRGYLEGGNERLAVYRDNSRPTFVAQEFANMVSQMPELTTYMPSLRRYLLEYPRVQLPDAESFLYWQETEFGLKPTIRISHLTIRQGAEDTVVVSKMLYASHYFWTGLELRVLLPDVSRGNGFWFVNVNRSRSDGLSGFAGIFVRRRVRGEVLDGMRAGLQMIKRTLERAR
jgi:hypothetical protein